MHRASFKHRSGFAIVAVILASAGSVHAAGPIEVIYTKKTGNPKAIVSGAVDLAGNPETAEWRGFDDLAVSPDGTRWMLRGRTSANDQRDTCVVIGSGLSGAMLNVGGRIIQEGQPALTAGGGTNGFIDFIPSGFGRFDSTNRFVLGIRARTTQTFSGSSTSAPDGQRVLFFDGTTLTLAFKQLDPYSGLADTTTAGDETVGNSVASFHLLNDGRIGSHDLTINNIASTRRPALTYNRTLFHQINNTSVTGFGGSGSAIWTGLTSNSFYTTPSGSHWIAPGTITPAATAQAVLVVNGTIVLQEGLPVAAGGPNLGALFQSFMAPNGRWIARGRDNSGTTAAAPDWVVRDNVLLAKTGDPITPGSTELWGDTFFAVSVNSIGDYIIAGNTNNTEPGRNEVIVYNGTTVIIREGDQVDLDGNGMFDDSTFVGRGVNTNTFVTSSVNNGQTVFWLTDDRKLFGLIMLRDGALSGNDVNITPAFGTPQAFIRMNVAPCAADFNGNGTLEVPDIFAFLAAWFGGNPQADFDGMNGLQVSDIFAFLAAWFAGCP